MYGPLSPFTMFSCCRTNAFTAWLCIYRETHLLSLIYKDLTWTFIKSSELENNHWKLSLYRPEEWLARSNFGKRMVSKCKRIWGAAISFWKKWQITAAFWMSFVRRGLRSEVSYSQFMNLETNLEVEPHYLPPEHADFGFQFCNLLMSKISSKLISHEQRIDIELQCQNFLKWACRKL